MNKKIKDEYMPGGARRQELLDKAVDYLRTPGATQNIKTRVLARWSEKTGTVRQCS